MEFECDEEMDIEFKQKECEDDFCDERGAPEAKAKEAPPEAPQRPPNVAKKPRVETEPAEAAPSPVRDYTKVPKDMDVSFEKFAPGSAVRPTIINVGSCWQKQSKKALLAPATSSTLLPEQQKQQKDAAFELLDAMTKSGALPLTHATLHIVIASTHCFDKTVTETVIQDNTNPIERVEQSTLIMASTVHQQPVKALVNQVSAGRLAAIAPQLMDAAPV